MNRRALIVFFKLPQPGRVKTRLLPWLSPADASQLYECFVKDTFQKVSQLDADLFAYLAHGELSADEKTYLTTLLPTHLPQKALLRHQHGAGLGERMNAAFTGVFAELNLYEQVAIIGTDSPHLPLEFFTEAFTAVDAVAPTVAIGATEDGGYYLLSMNRAASPLALPRVFENVRYSSPETFLDTVEQLRPLMDDQSLVLKNLPHGYDIDEPDDVLRLARELNPLDTPHTAAFLKSLLTS